MYPFSGRNYELRYGLAFARVDPDRDVRIVVAPPSQMNEELREGRIDGFCAGEPWNSLAVEAGLGAIVATKSQLWRQGPDKVLGLTEAFAQARPDALRRLLRARHAACVFASRPDKQERLAATLSLPEYADDAFGVTLYRMFARGYSYGEIEPFQRPRFEGYRPLSLAREDLPPWLDAAVAKAVALHPAQRHGDALEFAYELETGLRLAAPAPRASPPLIERDPAKV